MLRLEEFGVRLHLFLVSGAFSTFCCSRCKSHAVMGGHCTAYASVRRLGWADWPPFHTARYTSAGGQTSQPSRHRFGFWHLFAAPDASARLGWRCLCVGCWSWAATVPRMHPSGGSAGPMATFLHGPLHLSLLQDVPAEPTPFWFCGTFSRYSVVLIIGMCMYVLVAPSTLKTTASGASIS